MIKKVLVLATALLVSLSSVGTPVNAAQVKSALTSSTTSTQALTSQDTNELGLEMELLWCAKARTYDATVAEDLVPHTPEVLEAGNVYEIAIKVTNNTEDSIAIPWGVDYIITLPRVIAPDTANKYICSAFFSDHGNDDADKTTGMSANIKASEPIALRYVDFSNYVTYSDRDNRVGFNWESDSSPLDNESVVLQGSGQGFPPHTYRIISFWVEACSLAEWEEFAGAMRQEPVVSTISNVTESVIWERNSSNNAMHSCGEVLNIDFVVNIPQWLRDLTEKEGGWWRIMAQPRFGMNGTIGIELRFENHNCTYVLAANQVHFEDYDTDKWKERGRFVGAVVDGCDSYAVAENWSDHGEDYRWASLNKEDWGNLMTQDEMHVILEIEIK